ncbi:polyketide synthase like protein [Zymoseptoria brevis]|uniref:Polyketide synthase like protein n=1 Tax=Zymoseptoria brevis TaxID=1047168 RepID=A0A0F4GXE2_9PEZI|nr:polyketide synthase like protein [Zymoseptoria brevis]
MDQSRATVDGSYQGTDGAEKPINGFSLGAHEPIAIVGMSCNFAGGVSSPERLWELMAESRDCWTPIPDSRFDGAALYDADQQRLDRHHTKGGYFLESDPYTFDAQFFNLTAELASAMDPQLRMLLEGVYEAVEDAGMTLDELAGSNTSVFSGIFARDYSDMLVKDPESLPPSFVTGNGTAMFSNRISHFFNLKGTSTTQDTGCSGSMVSLHLGVQSLQRGETDMSIIGASSLILNPDFHIALSGIGVTGAAGRCYSWDSRWGGYGRGEGTVALVLKRLSDAVRDGDFVHSVIRESVSNQDGKTTTITSPSMESQRLLIEQCYRNAGLDLASTGYVEAHMTGTSGDVIEAEAIARTFGQSRKSGDPVYVGSVKTYVGHTEPVSGLASVVKTAMALRRRQIPANLNYDQPNPDIPLKEWNVQVPQHLTPWPKDKALRASVNNFGYGGTNVHAIMEAFDGRSNSRPAANGASMSATEVENSIVPDEVPQSFLFTVSARHFAGAAAMNKRLAAFIKEAEANQCPPSPVDLAYTLAVRKSRFPWTTAVRANNLQELASRLEMADRAPVRASTKPPRIGYVFSGQGAQWYGMARELLSTFDIFASAIKRADEILRVDFGASWSLHDELRTNEQDSRVHDVALGQPMSVAVQLCLVDLLSSWDIKPSAVVSHSSGEIAAAYATGVLSFREALGVVYHRGRLAQKYQKLNALSGGMAAVRLTVENAMEYINGSPEYKDRVVVACINSPKSLTLSGDLSAIDSLVSELEEDDIFARRLKVPMAYHSHHMQHMAQEYRDCLRELLLNRARTPNVPFASPVTGGLLDDFQPGHWAENLTGPVLFSSAVEVMMEIPDQAPEFLLEIGPHDTLSGPVRQIRSGKPVPYFGCLQRNVNAVHTMQDMACDLWARGYPILLSKINRLDHFTPKYVHSLPSYVWNHASRYTVEPRASREHRHKRFPPHELLGFPVPGANTLTPTWRNRLRTQNVAWLADHQLDSQVVLPGAAYVCMAIEAVRLLKGPEIPSGYRLRDVDIVKGLVIPSTGLETHFSLRPCDAKQLDYKDWFHFQLHSVGTDDSWALHCTGYVLADTKESPPTHLAAESLPLTDTSIREVDVESAFSIMRSLGFYYGPTFQNVKSCRVAGNTFHAGFEISCAVSQSEYALHPTTLDALFQCCYAGLPQEATTGVVLLPRSIERMKLGRQLGRETGQKVEARIDLLESTVRTIGFDSTAFMPEHASVETLDMRNFRLQRLDQSTSNSPEKTTPLGIHAQTRWEPDVLHYMTEPCKDSLKIHLGEADRRFEWQIREAAFHFVHAARSELQSEDSSHWPWHQHRMYDWMTSIVQQDPASFPVPGSDEWPNRDSSAKESLFSQLSAQNVCGELTVKVGRHLAAIVRGQVQPLELMMENELLHRYYQEIPMLQDRSFKQLRRIVELYALKEPGATVLEIGAGTGGATTHVLAGFGAQDAPGGMRSAMLSSYHFTDISSGFFAAAKEKFADWGALLQFSRLDIESDPMEQGFLPEGYDLIVAAEVLHATKSLRETMVNVRKLLKPGGKLILLETTNHTLHTQMLFGTLPGWWLSSEPTRRVSPNADVAMWERTLRDSGFSGVDFEIGDCEHPELQGCSVMVATAEGRGLLPENVSIVGCGTTPQPWMERLATEVESATGSRPIVERFADLQSKDSDADRVYILAMDMTAPFLSTINEAQFAQLQHLMVTSRGLYWLSRGGLATSQRPLWAQTQGLLRTLRREDTSRRFVHLDFDDGVDPSSAADTIPHFLHVLRATFDYSIPTAQGIDWEYAVKDSVLHVPRIYPDRERDRICRGDAKNTLHRRPFSSQNEVLTWEVEEGGTLGARPHFSSRAVSTTDGFPPDMVEIAPRAFGLNCSDLLTAAGMSKASGVSGHEASGIITQVGKSTDLCVGDRVCGLFAGHFSNRPVAKCSSVVKIPDTMPWEQAASIPYAFATAWLALHHVGKLQPGENVLIHSASGDVGQAGVVLAQEIGAKIFVTCGTAEKRELMTDVYGVPDANIFSNADDSFAAEIMAATAGRGLDVVLNSLEGQLLQTTWECMAPIGRFVHTGPMFDIEAQRVLPMAPFGRGATFASVDPFQYAQEAVFQSALREGVAVCKKRKNVAMVPVRRFPMRELDTCVKHRMTHAYMGKNVMVPAVGEEVEALRPVERVELRGDAAYMVVGGVGGVGSAIARWLVERGAGTLLIVSRHAESSPERGALADKAKTHGCEALFRNCDVACEDDLQRLLEQLKQEGAPPIRGVVNGAMVLASALLERMTYSQWTTALRPKVQTTLNLHTHLPSLDFFVLLSSITGAIGSASQANYTAANTFQDAFSRWRRAQGLPSVTIDLGLITDIRWGAEEEALRGRLEKAIAATAMSSESTVRLVAETIRSPLGDGDAGQMICYGERHGDFTGDEGIRSDKRWGPLVAAIAAEQRGKEKDGQQIPEAASRMDARMNEVRALASEAEGQEPSEELQTKAVEVVLGLLTARAAEDFNLNLDEVDPAVPLTHHGIDSLVAVQFRNWLGAAVKAQVGIFDILQERPLREFAGVVVEKSALFGHLVAGK